MASLPPFNFTKMLQIIFVAILVIFLLYSFINVSAISSGKGDWLKPNVEINEVALNFFILVILFIAVSVAMFIVNEAIGGKIRLDRNFFVSLVIFSIILYGLYSYVIQPGLCGALATDPTKCALPSLKMAAAQLYSISPAPIQSMFGLP